MLTFNYVYSFEIIQSSCSEDEMIASTSYYDIGEAARSSTDTAHSSASLFREKVSSSVEMSSSLANSFDCHPITAVSASDIQMLKEVFPNMDHQKMSDILAACDMDVEKAINKILSESGR